jgi:hypothetical protein
MSAQGRRERTARASRAGHAQAGPPRGHPRRGPVWPPRATRRCGRYGDTSPHPAPQGAGASSRRSPCSGPIRGSTPAEGASDPQAGAAQWALGVASVSARRPRNRWPAIAQRWWLLAPSDRRSERRAGRAGEIGSPSPRPTWLYSRSASGRSECAASSSVSARPVSLFAESCSPRLHAQVPLR